MLLREKLLSIHADLAIQSRERHYFKMCQIILIAKKSSISYIVKKKKNPVASSPEKMTGEMHVTDGY